MDWKTFFISLSAIAATLTASCIGLYYANKARTQPYREHLYRMQVDLACELLALVDEVNAHAVRVFTAGSEDEWKRAWVDLGKENLALQALTGRVAVLLPTDLMTAVLVFMRESADFMLVVTESGPAAQAFDALSAARTKCMDLTRQLVGVDSLTRESVSLIASRDPGQPPQLTDEELMTLSKVARGEGSKMMSRVPGRGAGGK